MGLDNSPVCTPTKDDKPKSIGRSTTISKDFTSNDEVWKAVLSFAEEISASLHRKGIYAGGIQVHIRTASLSVKEFSTTFHDMVNSSLILAKRGYKLFCDNYTFGEPLRSVGLRAINIKDTQNAVQQDMFGEGQKEEKYEKIEDSIFELREKYGKSSIKRASIVDSNK